MTSQWGTDRQDAVALLESAGNNRPVVVYDEDDDGRRVQNEQATLDAREKQEQLLARFADLDVGGPGAAATGSSTSTTGGSTPTSLAATTAAHLSLPGLAADVQPRPHQRDAVARILAEPRRPARPRGRRRQDRDDGHGGDGAAPARPGQQADGRRPQPHARPVLHRVARSCTRRPRCCSRPTLSRDRPAANGSSPGPPSATGTPSSSPSRRSNGSRSPRPPRRAFIDAQIDELRGRLGPLRRPRSAGGRAPSRRSSSGSSSWPSGPRSCCTGPTRTTASPSSSSASTTSFVDEAHHAKNLAISTRLPGLGKAGLRATPASSTSGCSGCADQYGAKVVTLATATPIANSLSEMWVMQHYAAPDTLAAAGIAHFDAWASNFAAQVTRLELAPEGTHYRIATRLAQVPQRPRPGPHVLGVRRRPHQSRPQPARPGPARRPRRGGRRARQRRPRRLRRRPRRAGRSRSAARRSPRTRTTCSRSPPTAAPPPSTCASSTSTHPLGATKLTVAADRIATIWARQPGPPLPRPDRRNPTRGPAPCSSCSPTSAPPAGPAGASTTSCAACSSPAGSPPDRCGSSTRPATPARKSSCSPPAATASVAVLVGSTEKMGVGTNVQARCVALHHLDCPWRPADVEQREGRILRQGNQNADVDVVRYVTAGSLRRLHVAG